MLQVPAALVRKTRRRGLVGGFHAERAPSAALPSAPAPRGGSRALAAASRAAPIVRGRNASRTTSPARTRSVPSGRDVEPPPRRGEPEHGTTAVPRVAPPRDETAPFQPAEDARERARVKVQDQGELPGRDPGKAPDDAQHEALGTRHTERGGHPLRAALQAVIDRPQQPHELEASRRAAGVARARAARAGRDRFTSPSCRRARARAAASRPAGCAARGRSPPAAGCSRRPRIPACGRPGP